MNAGKHVFYIKQDSLDKINLDPFLNMKFLSNICYICIYERTQVPQASQMAWLLKPSLVAWMPLRWPASLAAQPSLNFLASVAGLLGLA